ncbi:MAG: DISARM system phospholipase D-like protein DrmC [Bryobacteraceae bacterium]|jgi:phosphatidylserine/phosphatidylglycerophosphate/cardiolipin synthase-like enzyme
MKLIRSLPASALESISQALKAGRLKPPYTAFTVAEWVPENCRNLLAADLMSLQTCGFTTATLAITLEVLAEDAAARQRAIDQIQLVWTSPDEEGPHVRDTSVVVRQLLSEARQSLWISTYSIFNGQEVFLPIEQAWTFRPELEVVLILNVPPNDDAAVEKYAWSFWKYHWPWPRKPAVFYDPRGPEKTPNYPACQHAKCILVDGVTAFITSANFTESAQERNIELGVLFRDNPRVAESIRSKFESLIQDGFLKPLPAR